VNGTQQCIGTITRQNLKNIEEKSAIDFVVASKDVFLMIEKMYIDEDCQYVLEGKNKI
jgi:hypothetical protein